MLWTASVINGYAVVAKDGQIGTVSDFLFDDDSWLIRWLIVDTGNWLSGRKVLLPSSALGSLDAKEEKCSVKLTMRQIEDSPEIDTDRPVSSWPPRDPPGRPVMRPLIAGNWKMQGMAPQLGDIEAIAASVKATPPFADILICLPATLIARAV